MTVVILGLLFRDQGENRITPWKGSKIAVCPNSCFKKRGSNSRKMFSDVSQNVSHCSYCGVGLIFLSC